ncbi:hypothetical protein RHODOSMS8_03794 [Rhodobiaceae bacterium]|nr:hypothetical protein RHODOSMS8_03794 [Rhodobiaceae bacterium]
MTEETEAKKAGLPKSTAPAESREERLSAALRKNLKRRKAQARNRKSDGPADAPNTTDETS